MEVKLSIEAVNAHNKDNIGALYDVLHTHKAFSAFMYGGKGRQGFIDFCYEGWIYTCHLDGKLVGVTVFNSFNGKTALFHFCMIDAQEHTADFGRLIFHTIFSGGYLGTVLGATPKCYRHVFPILHSVGFSVVDSIDEYALIQGKLRTVIFSKITKEQFYKHNHNQIKGF